MGLAAPVAAGSDRDGTASELQTIALGAGCYEFVRSVAAGSDRDGSASELQAIALGARCYGYSPL